MEKNIALSLVRVTEAGALAAAGWVGKGDKNAADGAAVSAMRERFSSEDMDGIVVIGEGEKDEAPELYVGEKLGTGYGPALDIAVDPVEGTASVADGTSNAVTVLATGPRGSLLSAPDLYMDKIAVGPRAKGSVDFSFSVEENISRVAAALDIPISLLVVAVLDRPRHEKLISEIRAAGARVRLFSDGDVAYAIATAKEQSGVHMMLGIGGSTESVLAAAALKCLDGALLSRFAPKDDNDRARLLRSGILDTNRVYTENDLASGEDITFTATGIVDGPLLRGVRETTNHFVTHSIVMRAKSGTVRYMETFHKK